MVFGEKGGTAWWSSLDVPPIRPGGLEKRRGCWWLPIVVALATAAAGYLVGKWIKGE